MKKYCHLILILVMTIPLQGQDNEQNKQVDSSVDKRTKEPQGSTSETTPAEEKAPPKLVRTRKPRIPDSMQPEYISLQLGFAFSVFGTAGANVTLTYEKKTKDQPFAWFANYTFINVDDEKGSGNYEHTYDPNTNYFIYTEKILERIEINAHHFGGGLHYYFRDYDRKLKLYTGAGAFVGFNHHERQFENDGAIDGNGLDFGAYAVIGIRWCRRHVKVGFEHRLGFIQTTLFDKHKSGAINELSFCIGVQF